MPAPVPITIRYGQDPTLMGGLALGAGQASYARSQAQQDYENWLRRRALDNDLLIAKMRADTEEKDMQLRNQNRLDAANLYNQNRLDVAGMNDASRIESASLRAAAGYGRSRAQAAGSTSAQGQANAPLNLVPAEGPLNRSSASMSVRPADGNGDVENYSIDDQGRILHEITQNELGQSWNQVVGQGRPSDEKVTPDTRKQLDYLRSIGHLLNPDQAAALMIAAKSGKLKMDQLVDDARQAIPKPAAPKLDAEGRAQDRYSAENEELQSVAAMPPRDQIAYARAKYNMRDQMTYGDQQVYEALQSRMRQVSAFLKPVQNSGGKTPTGGNVVQVQTPQEAMQLPSGTYFMTPDGRIKRVP